MAKISPYKNHSIISPTRDGIEVLIPSKKNWFIIIFLFAWIGGWFSGEKSAIQQILNGHGGPQIFLIFWLIGWSVGGGFAVLVWLWSVTGKEIIQANMSSIKHIRSIGGLKVVREYDLTHVKELRVLPGQSGVFGRRNGLEGIGFSGGPISFDYGAKTIRLGAGIDEAEAKRIVEEIRIICKSI